MGIDKVLHVHVRDELIAFVAFAEWLNGLEVSPNCAPVGLCIGDGFREVELVACERR